tara:strand:- start:946 stop:1878 length:933 start_codon:yes stop_codon:yes gene_type:complete
MARHLYIGNNVAVARTAAGILDNKAVEIQKLSASGPTAMVAGDTIADSSQFRIVQGTGTRDIVSPWIYGKDVINWSGKSAAAQQAQVFNIDFQAVNATAAGTHELKLINMTNGAEPFQMKSYEIAVAAGATATVQSAAFKVAIDADLPHWVNGPVTDNNGDIDVTGFTKGASKADGSVQDELVEMRGATGMDGSNGTVATLSSTTAGSQGTGDGFYVRKMEDDQKGNQYGYYFRGHLPNTPADNSVTGTAYDMYTIAATKDGSSASQIHGVDNLIEVNIAFDPATAALTGALESVLNGYLASVNLAPVNL